MRAIRRIPGMNGPAYENTEILESAAARPLRPLLFLVHGEPRACDALSAAIKSRSGWDAHIPADAERVVI